MLTKEEVDELTVLMKKWDAEIANKSISIDAAKAYLMCFNNIANFLSKIRAKAKKLKELELNKEIS